MKISLLRAPITILLAFSALFFPFWVTASFFVFGTFAFKNFYLGLVIIFIMDAIYTIENVKIGLFYGMITISAILCFFLIQVLKERLLKFD